MKVTIKYGATDTFTKEYQTTPTFGQICSDSALKAVLGFGDNVRALVSGVEQPMENLVPDGAKVRIETRANSKAGAITIVCGQNRITRDMPDPIEPDDILLDGDLGELMGFDNEFSIKLNGQFLGEDSIIPAGSTVEVVKAEFTGSANVAYGTDSHTHALKPGETFGELRTNPTLKAVLGFGDNVRALVNGVEQPDGSVVPNGCAVRIEVRANAKA